MPITPATLTPKLVSSLQGFTIGGISKPQLANAIATGFTQFLPTIPVNTTHIGILGAGTGTGKVSIEPSSGIGIVTSSLKAQDINGPSATQLATGVCTGLTAEINSNALVQVAIVGSSIGAGTGTLSNANGQTLTQLLQASFKANGITGPSSDPMARGLGEGIANWLKTAVINTIDVGGPIFPFPASVGSGTGSVF